MSIDTDMILNARADRLNTSMGSDAADFKGKNALPLPQPLPEAIQVTEDYLKQFNHTQNFKVYRVLADFHPLEKRHMRVARDEKVIGFAEEDGWICAFKESSKKDFGFLPAKYYLKFEHQTNSQNVTPTSRIGAAASDDTGPPPGPPTDHAGVTQNSEQVFAVKGFLDDVYKDANTEGSEAGN